QRTGRLSSGIFRPIMSIQTAQTRKTADFHKPMGERLMWDHIAGIVFDAVGTLIKPDPSVAVAYTGAARRQGVELEPEDVRARFHLHFQSDAVHGARGVLSTDEATERRRWRQIVCDA